MTTKERLAEELREARAPEAMIEKAWAGEYDDFESESATPIMNLVSACRAAGLHKMAERAIAGEFDANVEEGEAWFAREGLIR